MTTVVTTEGRQGEFTFPPFTVYNSQSFSQNQIAAATMWNWMHRLGSPPVFYRLAERAAPPCAWICALLLAAGAWQALVVAPPDYKQAEGYRIMFVHVPAAWLSMMVYVCMAAAAAVRLVWRIKIAAVLAVAAAPIGASFAAVTLATGSIWGKPMWGAWWVWDARLTSELILLLLYLGFIGLQTAIPDRNTAEQAGAILLLVGVANIPVIHFSVEWWNTLHQPASIMKFGAPSIHPAMLPPLALMSFGFLLFAVAIVLTRAQAELLRREHKAKWARTWTRKK